MKGREEKGDDQRRGEMWRKTHAGHMITQDCPAVRSRTELIKLINKRKPTEETRPLCFQYTKAEGCTRDRCDRWHPIGLKANGGMKNNASPKRPRRTEKGGKGVVGKGGKGEQTEKKVKWSDMC